MAFHTVQLCCLTPDTIAGYCAQHPRNVIPDPSNCHRYYDCSTYNTPLGGYLMECPYPQMFDATWTLCREKQYVSCGLRPIPTSQCEYPSHCPIIIITKNMFVLLRKMYYMLFSGIQNCIWLKKHWFQWKIYLFGQYLCWVRIWFMCVQKLGHQVLQKPCYHSSPYVSCETTVINNG